jgi:hypothetical protein
MTEESHQYEGPLAEFVALRQEIQERVKAQQQLIALQLTLSGAVFAYALSRPGLSALLLAVPFSSYLLCGRTVAQHFGTLRVAEYIRDELSSRVPGGLRWEAWIRREPRSPNILGFALPHLLTFVGASVLSLAWTFGHAFMRDGISLAPKAGLIALWLLGLAVTGLSAALVLQMAGKLPIRSWEQTGLS